MRRPLELARLLSLRPALAPSLLLVATAVSRDAGACGPTPTEVVQLLPEAAAVGVPLNAVLISSSNTTLAQLWLRRAPGAGADTASEVELETACDLAFSGAVCVGRPIELLDPNTRYEWRAEISLPADYERSALPPPDWRPFTTGSQLDEMAPATSQVEIEVIDDHSTVGSPCGDTRVTELAYLPRSLREPVVLGFAGFTPSYVMHATLVLPERPRVEATLYSAPDCLDPVLYDAVGQKVLLPQLCLGPPAADAPQTSTSVPVTQEVARPPSSSAQGGCALGAGSCPGLGWQLLGLCFCLRRRRFRSSVPSRF